MAIRRTRAKCFLDQDGVIADFVGGACRVHSKLNPFILAKNLGEFELIKIWGMTEQQFWAPIDALGVAFWEGLEPTQEAAKLVDFVTATFGQDNVAVLTAPSEDPGCIPGKRAWMKKYFPKLERKMIFANASNKRFLAGPENWLVDDRDRNVDQFLADGGNGVLVPRPWNSGHGVVDVVKAVRDEIDAVLAVQPLPQVPRGPLPAALAGQAQQGARNHVRHFPSPGPGKSKRWPPAGGRPRGVASDDICLLCCAYCGTAYNSGVLHQCHPDAGSHGGPRC